MLGEKARAGKKAGKAAENRRKDMEIAKYRQTIT